MEFRQECSSGRVVGFLWLVITPPGHVDLDPSHDDSDDWALIGANGQKAEICTSLLSRPQQQRPKPKKRKPLTGPIHPRPKGGFLRSSYDPLSDPHNKRPVHVTVHDAALLSRGITVSKSSYEKSLSTLLHLDAAPSRLRRPRHRDRIHEEMDRRSLQHLRVKGGWRFQRCHHGSGGAREEIHGVTAGVEAGVGQPYADADDSVLRVGVWGLLVLISVSVPVVPMPMVEGRW
jgi:hypothetical protein